jgi:hypothetical protein
LQNFTEYPSPSTLMIMAVFFSEISVHVSMTALWHIPDTFSTRCKSAVFQFFVCTVDACAETVLDLQSYGESTRFPGQKVMVARQRSGA